MVNELRDLYLAFVEVAKKKVDPVRVATWRPDKLLVFMRKSAKILSTNKEAAYEQRDEITDLLKSYPIYYEAACLAQDVYSKEGSFLPGGWTRSLEFRNLVYNTTDGLVSSLYSRNLNGHKEYIYAIAGTDPHCLSDWKNNLGQLYGDSSQYEDSLKVAIELKRQIDSKDTLLFVGHSLGGGIATYNALQTNSKAIVYNPVSLSDESLSTLPCSVAQNCEDITVFVATNDILNLFQDVSQLSPGMKQVFKSTIGKRYYLQMPSSSHLNSHSIGNIIKCMEGYLQR